MSDRVTERTMSLRTYIFPGNARGSSRLVASETKWEHVRVDNNYFLLLDHGRRWLHRRCRNMSSLETIRYNYTYIIYYIDLS